MNEYIYKEYTERDLPHIQPPDATLFVTFRLAGSIPKSVLRVYRAQKLWWEEETRRILALRIKEDSPEMRAHEERLLAFRRQWFVKFEEILHQAEAGPSWLKNESVAKIVADALHYRDGKVYRLDAYCIMSNHVHALFAPFLAASELREVLLPEGMRFLSQNPPLDKIMKSLKGYSAWEANNALGRRGNFWYRESYDHVVRNQAEFDRIVKYVLNNPVKAGLVKEWQEWPWSYRRPPDRRPDESCAAP
ncbi:MAG: transposase [Blastocatellales bacterium]